MKSLCRDCDSEKARAYYQANRDVVLAKRIEAALVVEASCPPKRCRRCGAVVAYRRRWYCDECRELVRRVKDRGRRRGYHPPDPRSMEERGYGREHWKLRARFKEVVEAGGALCARCGLPISPFEPWDLGHVDGFRDRWSGPEHRRCNRATATHRQMRVLEQEIDVSNARSPSRAW